MPRLVPIVFVSSTMQDLKAYRSAVQASFPALDVLYRGMEFFGARPYRTREVLKKEVPGSDLLVGIVAHRYGSRDPSNGQSYCEAEFRLAKKLNIPTIYFLMDESQPVHTQDMEQDAEARVKLDEFKQKIRRETVYESFTTPDDLVIKVARSLEKWLGETNWQRLRHVPVTEAESDYIRQLHSSNPDRVKHSTSRLSKPDCRAFFENLYARLYRTDLPVTIIEDLFDQFKFFQDDGRAAQMLLSLAEDVSEYRYCAVSAMGERARSDERHVTPAEVDCVIRLRNDSSPPVRREVAHAMWKFGVRYPGRIKEFLGYLKYLKEDPDDSVRDKAQLSEQRMPAYEQAAARGR